MADEAQDYKELARKILKSTRESARTAKNAARAAAVNTRNAAAATAKNAIALNKTISKTISKAVGLGFATNIAKFGIGKVTAGVGKVAGKAKDAAPGFLKKLTKSLGIMFVSGLFIKTIMPYLKDGLKEAFKYLKDKFPDIINPVLEKIGQLKDKIVSWIEAKGVPLAKELFTKVKELFGKVSQWLVDNGPKIVNFLVDSFFSTLNTVTEFILKNSDKILNLIGVTLNKVFELAINFITKYGPQIFDFVLKTVSIVFKAIYDFIDQNGTKIIDFFLKAVEKIADFLMDAISTYGPPLLNAVMAGVSALLTGVVSFLQTNGERILDKVIEIAENIADFALNAITTYGPALLQKILGAISSLVPMIVNGMFVIAEKALGLFNKYAPKLLDIVISSFNIFVSEITNFIQNSLGPIIIRYLGFLKEFATSIVSLAKKYVPIILNTVIDTIVNFISTGLDFASKYFATISSAITDYLSVIVLGAIDIIKNYGPTFIKKITEGAGMLIDKISTMLTNVIPGLLANGDKLLGIGESILQKVYEIVPMIVNGLANFVATIVPKLISLVETVVPLVVNSFVSISANIIVLVSEFVKNDLPQVLSETLAKLGESLVWLSENFATEVPKFLIKVIDTVSSLVENLGATIIKYGPTAIETIVGGLWELTKGLLVAIIKYGPTVLLNVVAGLGSLMIVLLEGIASFAVKALVIITVGLWKLTTDMVAGIVEFTPLAVAFLGTKLQELGSAIYNIITIKIPELIGSMGTFISSFIGDMGLKAIELGTKIVNSLMSGITTFINAFLSDPVKAFTGLAEGIIKIVTDSVSFLKTKIEDLFSTIIEGLKSTIVSLIGPTLFTSLPRGLQDMLKPSSGDRTTIEGKNDANAPLRNPRDYLTFESNAAAVLFDKLPESQKQDLMKQGKKKIDVKNEKLWIGEAFVHKIIDRNSGKKIDKSSPTKTQMADTFVGSTPSKQANSSIVNNRGITNQNEPLEARQMSEASIPEMASSGTGTGTLDKIMMSGKDIDSVKPTDVLDLNGTAKTGFTKANKDLQYNFKAMGFEYYQKYGKKMQINSAYRSIKEQQSLWNDMLRRNGGKPDGSVATVGGSLHNYGLAMDMNSTDANKADSAGLFAKYGLHRPVKGETWHVEPTSITKEKAQIAANGRAMARSGANMDEVSRNGSLLAQKPSTSMAEVAAERMVGSGKETGLTSIIKPDLTTAAGASMQANIDAGTAKKGLAGIVEDVDKTTLQLAQSFMRSLGASDEGGTFIKGEAAEISDMSMEDRLKRSANNFTGMFKQAQAPSGDKGLASVLPQLNTAKDAVNNSDFMSTLLSKDGTANALLTKAKSGIVDIGDKARNLASATVDKVLPPPAPVVNNINNVLPSAPAKQEEVTLNNSNFRHEVFGMVGTLF